MLPGGSDGRESACNVGDPGLIPGSGRPAWRREWILTPVFLPGKSHGQRSLVGSSPWGHKELDRTEQITLSGTGRCSTSSLGIEVLPIHCLSNTFSLFPSRNLNSPPGQIHIRSADLALLFPWLLLCLILWHPNAKNLTCHFYSFRNCPNTPLPRARVWRSGAGSHLLSKWSSKAHHSLLVQKTRQTAEGHRASHFLKNRIQVPCGAKQWCWRVLLYCQKQSLFQTEQLSDHHCERCVCQVSFAEWLFKLCKDHEVVEWEWVLIVANNLLLWIKYQKLD